MKSIKTKLLSVIVSLFLFSFLAAPVVFAEFVETRVGPTSVTQLINLIDNVAIYIQVIVLTIAIIMIIFAGVGFMMAGGDEEKIKSARSKLIWGLVGIAVVLFAYVAKTFIIDLLSKTS